MLLAGRASLHCGSGDIANPEAASVISEAILNEDVSLHFACREPLSRFGICDLEVQTNEIGSGVAATYRSNSFRLLVGLRELLRHLERLLSRVEEDMIKCFRNLILSRRANFPPTMAGFYPFSALMLINEERKQHGRHSFFRSGFR